MITENIVVAIITGIFATIGVIVRIDTKLEGK